MSLRLVYSPRFRRKFRKLDFPVREQVKKALRQLAENPYHPSLRTHKREGESETWQARVSRCYRLYFEMEGEELRLVDIVAHEK